MSRWKVLFLIIIIFIIGFITGQIKHFGLKEPPSNIHEVRATGYQYTSPLLRVDLPSTDQDQKVKLLKEKLDEFITDNINNKKASQISVYFRNPSHYRWFVVNEKEKYTPASAMKVITLMAAFKKAEAEPKFLDQQITYDKQINPFGYNFPPQKDLELGKTYSVQDLLNFMIIYSSNEAQDLLSSRVDFSEINKLLESLQLDVINLDKSEDFMNIYTYSSFFRTLYNASYLSNTMSEKALELLTKTTFTEGLANSLPMDIKIAHKFGERNNTDIGIKQLHDCGIVYFPNNHYLLCIMTKGTSFDDLKLMLQSISAITYREVNSWKED